MDTYLIECGTTAYPGEQGVDVRSWRSQKSGLQFDPHTRNSFGHLGKDKLGPSTDMNGRLESMVVVISSVGRATRAMTALDQVIERDMDVAARKHLALLVH
mgnify:FL=1